jgi:hypothetical protein
MGCVLEADGKGAIDQAAMERSARRLPDLSQHFSRDD